jgi:hypothetical protein
MSTKLELCKNYLKSGRSISPAEAMVAGMGMRLADLIYRMRKDEGIPVVTEIRENPTTGEKYARYRLPRQGDRVKYTGSLPHRQGEYGVVRDFEPRNDVAHCFIEMDSGNAIRCRAQSIEPAPAE